MVSRLAFAFVAALVGTTVGTCGSPPVGCNCDFSASADLGAANLFWKSETTTVNNVAYFITGQTGWPAIHSHDRLVEWDPVEGYTVSVNPSSLGSDDVAGSEQGFAGAQVNFSTVASEERYALFSLGGWTDRQMMGSIGSDTLTDKIAKFDITTGTWTLTGQTIDTPAYGMTCVTLNGDDGLGQPHSKKDYILCWGGKTAAGTAANIWGYFDVHENTWVPLANMNPSALGDVGIVEGVTLLLDNDGITNPTLFLQGGLKAVGGCSTSLYSYQLDLTQPATSWFPAAGSWTSHANMPVGMCGSRSFYIKYRDILVVTGGSTTATGTATNKVYQYDKGWDCWYEDASITLSTARKYHSLVNAHGRVLISGGKDGTGYAISSGEFSDEQSQMVDCNDLGSWDASASTWPTENAAPGLPVRTAGFSFSANVKPPVTCSTGDCTILRKSDCTIGEGGFKLAIRNDKWQLYLGAAEGWQAFSGVSDVTYDVAVPIDMTLTPPDTWAITVGGESGTVSGHGVGEAEMPLHNVLIGGEASCGDRFLGGAGTITFVQIGDCNPLTVLEVTPGMGSYNVPVTTPITITLTDPNPLPWPVNATHAGTPVQPFTGKFLTIRASTGATQTISADNLAGWMHTPPTPVATAGSAARDPDCLPSTVTPCTAGPVDPVSFDSATKFTISPGTTTFQWVPGAVHEISVDVDFFKPDGGEGNFPGIVGTDWMVHAAYSWPGYATTCDDVVMVFNMDPLTWDEAAFCTTMQRQVYGIPCANIFQTRRRHHGDSTIHFTFRFINMAPGTCSTVLANLASTISTGFPIDLKAMREQNGAVDNVDHRAVRSSIVHTGTFTVVDGVADEYLPITFQVFNVPDTAGSLSEVSVHLKPTSAADAVPANPWIEIVMPYDYEPDQTVITTFMSIDSGATWTACQAPAVSGTSLLAWCSGVSNAPYAIFKMVDVKMPASCEKLNSFMWGAKAYADAGGSAGTMTNWIVKNPETDRCEGEKIILFGDPHFQSFSGGAYDVNGRSGYTYNIISDRSFAWNSKFVSLNPKGTGTMHTFLGESAFLIAGNRVHCDPAAWAMFVNGKRVTEMDTRLYLAENQPWYVKLTQSVMYVRAPGFFIGLKHIAKEHGRPLPHFDHVVSLTGEEGGRVFPHGLLGQTARFTEKVVSTGKQGEGVIEGTVRQYELPQLWSTDFEHNQYVA